MDATLRRRLRLLAALTTALVMLWLVVPFFAEQIQYAMTRGRQRAEQEGAGRSLNSSPLDQISQAYQRVSQRVAPSVVHIHVVGVVETPQADELSNLFGSRRRESLGQGSGVIVDAAGFILTNNHVVANAKRIEVGLSDGRTIAARIVGLDALTDLALVQVDAANLTAAEWGDSDNLEVGALVWAVGSPFGLQHSITAGILSGKNRQGLSSSIYHDFLQTDAAVNPGSSGGPLVDVRGRVIGINTAIYGEAYRGISFAIPSKEAREVYDGLRSLGRVERGWLGVGLENLDAESASRFRSTADRGVLVVRTATNSPAERAGLLAGDVLLQWDGHPVENSSTLSRLIARTKIGTAVEMVIDRRGQQLKLSVTVGTAPVSPGG